MDAAGEAIERGAVLFTEGEHFAAHEVWEERWRVVVDGDERRVLQGLIQVAAGCHKIFRQGKRDSGGRLLARGLAKLEGGVLRGWALEVFVGGVRAAIEAVARGEPVRAPLLLRYAAYYCEENAWHLARHPALAGRSPAVVFIGGAAGTCVMWGQRVATEAGAPVFWDYHAVVLVRDPWQVWDLDTTLGCPVAAGLYLRRSFRPEMRLPREVAPWFRVVGVEELGVFASDRTHMRGADGGLVEPPPPWPVIGRGSNLMRFLDPKDRVAGEVLDLAGLAARVGEDVV